MIDLEKLKKNVAQVFQVPEGSINEQTMMTDIDTWDSLTHMELILMLENEFHVTFSGEEIIAMTGYSSIVKTLSAKGV